MSLIAKAGEQNYTPAPQGVHLAICVQLIDLGTQPPHPNSPYGKSSHRVLIGWELCNEKNEDGNPMLVWKEYTVSLFDQSHMYKDLVSWRGRAFSAEELEAFDLKNILGKPCQLQIIHEKGKGLNSNKTYSRVERIMACTKSQEIPKQVNETILYDIDNHDPEVFSTFSERNQERIKQSAEWKALHNGGSGFDKANSELQEAAEEEKDNIPF
jgi:hypothetical protein